MDYFKRISLKKVFFGILILCVLGVFAYAGKGAYEYKEWLNIKKAVAGGGYTNLYAGTLGAVTTGCTYTQSGCTCSLCNDCGCNTYSQATITMGQAVNQGALNLCVNESVQIKGAPLVMSAGKQFMAGSMTGKCLMGTAVMATPSIAASNFEKVLSSIERFIIAASGRIKK